MKKFLCMCVIAMSMCIMQKPVWAFEGISAELAADASYITYKEPGIKEEGAMYGLSGALDWHQNLKERAEGMMFKADGRVSFGQVNYDGELSDGTPYKIKNINDFIGEVRLCGGYDFPVFEATVLTPYFGAGYRYLKDDLSKDPAGYDRESNYIYSPVGLQARTDLGSGWFAGANVEYDIFWRGWQKSHLSDAVSTLSDVTNTQKGGYGLRAAVRLGKKCGKIDWFVEPFVRYWSIDKSEESDVALSGTIIGTVVEPNNHSTETGVRIGILF